MPRFARFAAIGLLLTLVLSGCAPSTDGGAAAPAAAPETETAAPPTDRPDVEARLAELGVTLPTLPAPTANYVRAVTTGNLVFLAGHGPLTEDGSYITGKIPGDHSPEEGYAAARLTCIALLSSLKAEIGDLNRVERVVKVFGMVNTDADFKGHSQVINGCSDFLFEVFGERGRHARAAVGMVSLPIGLAVEIDMVVEIAP